MLRVVAIVATITLPTVSAAQNCQQIADDTDRLACYDAQFPVEEAVATDATADPQTDSKWIVETEVSAIDDSTSVFLTVPSNEIASCGFAPQTSATLTLRCMENTTALIIGTSCHLTSGFSGYGEVTMRVDGETAVTRSFDHSTDNSSLGLWNGRTSIPVIQGLIDADTLIARLTPYNDNPIQLTFDLAGLEREIVPLREACNW